MKHIKTVNKPYLQATIKTGGCIDSPFLSDFKKFKIYGNK